MKDSDTANAAALVRSKVEAPCPPRHPRRCGWAGKGTGLTCDACGVQVTSADIEYETDLPSQRTLRFHQRCLTVWHEERVKARAS